MERNELDGQKMDKKNFGESCFIFMLIFLGIASAQNYVITQDTIDDLSKCPIPPKHSECKNSFDKKTTDEITLGWRKPGESCDPDKHSFVFAEFFLTPDPHAFMRSGYKDPAYLEAKKQSCNILRFQTCDRTTRKCACREGAVLENGECKLAGLAFDRRDKCDDNLVWNNQNKSQTQVFDDPRTCFLNFILRCASNSKCMCYPPIDPDSNAEAKTTTGRVCNPEIGDQKAKNIAKQILTNAERYTWIKLGEPCVKHHNFGGGVKSHVAIKVSVVQWLQEFVSKKRERKLCDPFEHLTCNVKTKKCDCAVGFVLENDKCRLAPFDNDYPEYHEDGPIDDYYSCEWFPRFKFYIPHYLEQHNYTSFLTMDPKFMNFVTKRVDCVDNAECLPLSDEDPTKVCKCKEGKSCNSMHHNSAKKNLSLGIWSLSLAALALALTINL